MASNLNTSNFGDSIKTLYEKVLLTRARPRLVHNNWGKQASWKGFGSYELRKFSSLSALTDSLNTEGGTPAEQDAPTVSTITITPDWYGSWIGYTDKLEVVQYDNVIGETVALLGEQAGETFDNLTRDALASGATLKYAGTATARNGIDATNDLFGFDEFLEGLANLEAQNAMPVEGGSYAMICHPFTWANLINDTNFFALFTREGGKTVRDAHVGKILNCNIYVTSNAKTYAGEGAAGIDVYTALFIGAESYALAGFTGMLPKYSAGMGSGELDNNTGKKFSGAEIIIKQLGETGLDPLNQRGTIGWKATHEEHILNSSWLVKVEHAVSFS